jgi:uncharacterized protein
MEQLQLKVPIKDSDRLHSLDILRGIAIFGILLVNGPTLNSPVTLDSVDFAFKSGVLDQWYTTTIFALAVGNFYPIFACLFGVSAAIFIGKAMPASTTLFTRRMFVLMLFGFSQVIFIWWGDVLVAYSILGLSLALIAKLSDANVRKIIVALVLVTGLMSVGTLWITEGAQLYPLTNSLFTYQEGSFWQITLQRSHDFIWAYAPWLLADIDALTALHFLLFLMQVYLCFVVGFYAYRSGLIKNLITHRSVAQKMFLLTLMLTIIVTTASWLSGEHWGDFFYVAEGFARASFYIATVFFACHIDAIRNVLKPFQWVGRMSLSNYLFHNLMLSLVFYGYGLGFYGRVGPVKQLPILLFLMSISLIGSRWWFTKYQFGPLEWLWRVATYGKWLRNRKELPTPQISTNS